MSILRTPSSSKFKYQFNRQLPKKGHKGLSSSHDASIIIKSKNTCLLTPEQLEGSRRIMAKAIREEYGKLNIRPYPNLPLSKKPLQMRMGRGKGRPERWVASVTRGTPLFEIFGPISFMFIKQLYRLVDLRFPIFSKIVVKKSGRPKNVFETNARCKIK